MKRIIYALVLLALLFTLPAPAQTATLTSAESGTALRVAVLYLNAPASRGYVTLHVLGAGQTVQREYSVGIPPVDFDAFLTALGSPRSGETGLPRRRVNFRIIGWLADNARLTDASGATVTITLAP